MLSYLVPRNRKLTFLFLCLNLGEKYQEASHKMGEKIEMLVSNTDTKQEI